MERDPVDSSDLASVGYDAETRTLEVEFQSGAVYQYFNVGPGTYESLMLSHSKGRYFSQNIKWLFRYEQVE